MATVAWLGESTADDPELVGGKTANLSLLAAAFPVPEGFCVFGTEAGDDNAQPVFAGYAELGKRCGTKDPLVAVRSSASDEDSGAASFAGQHETLLGVRGGPAVVAAVAECVRSFSSERALAYRRGHGLADSPRGWAVLVQRLVIADAAGVAFSLDPVSGDSDVVLINANFGLGESVVSGMVSPDSYSVHRDGRVESRIGNKRVMTVPVPGGVDEVAVPRSLIGIPALDTAQVLATAELALDLERRMEWPVDVEFARADERLFLLQCRPVTKAAA